MSALIAQAILLILYMTSIGFRTLVRRRAFTVFDIVQTAFALVIGLAGAFQIAKVLATAHLRSRCSRFSAAWPAI